MRLRPLGLDIAKSVFTFRMTKRRRALESPRTPSKRASFDFPIPLRDTTSNIPERACRTAKAARLDVALTSDWQGLDDTLMRRSGDHAREPEPSQSK